MTNLLHRELSEAIIETYFDVYNQLGFGFLEKVYQNAMFFELKSKGYKVQAQKQINVYYKDKLVGEFYADIVINDVIIIELKACENICEAHKAQLLNYLKGTQIEVGILLNFGERPEFKRLIFTNDRKRVPQQ